MAGILGATSTDYSDTVLIAGDHHSQSPVTVVSGTAAMVKGQLVGMLTATFKYTDYDPAAADGSEVPRAILNEDVDASAADVSTMALFSGIYNADAITWPTVTDAQKNAAIKAMRDAGIIFPNQGQIV